MPANAPATFFFFDLGSTLVDEDDAHRARMERVASVLARHGRETSVEALWQQTERASEARAPYPFLEVLSQLDLAPAVLEEARHAARYEHARERLYPGVPALLSRLAASFELGVIANQSRGTADRLREHGIAQHFSVIASSAELGMAKPDAAIFLWALERAGCRADEVVMVGDRLDNDVAPANALGMRSVRVLQGFARVQRPRSAAETPYRTIAAIDELADEVVDVASGSWSRS